MPATTQQLGDPDRFRALRRPVVMPRHAEYLLAGAPVVLVLAEHGFQQPEMVRSSTLCPRAGGAVVSWRPEVWMK